MAKSELKNQQHKKIGKQEKSTLMYLVGAILVLVLLFLGMKVYSTYPEVSYNDIKTLSAAVNSELKALEVELVEQYKLCFENDDKDAWATFSQEWISRIGMSKPSEFGKRLSDKSMDLVNASNFVSRDLFQLWTEYNLAIESGTPVDVAKEKALIDTIQGGQAFIDKIISK